MAGVEQLVDFRVEQGLAFNVQINMVRMRFDLVQYAVECIQLDEFRLPSRLRAEAACEIANAGNFDINLFKRFQDGSPFRSCCACELYECC